MCIKKIIGPRPLVGGGGVPGAPPVDPLVRTAHKNMNLEVFNITRRAGASERM